MVVVVLYLSVENIACQYQQSQREKCIVFSNSHSNVILYTKLP